MGLETATLRFFLSATNMGMKMDSVCTLGRLSVHAKPSELASILTEYNRYPPDFWEVYQWKSATPFADSLLQILGFTHIDSMDASDYEGASIIHDLNQPVPDALLEQYDVVLDGGTLEHVFHFPTALENAMRMVKQGGHLILEAPANGLCGHGFYQISPELFFRALCPKYGFELLRIYLSTGGRFYHVVDPLIVHGRVELRRGSAALYVHARKIGQFRGFSVEPPQQSDYVTSWKGHEAGNPKVDGKLKGWLRKKLSPESVETISKHLNRLRQRRYVWRWKRSALPSNRRLYVPVKHWDVPTKEVTGSP